MTIKPARGQARPTASQNPQAPRMQHKTLPAPTRGWVTNENLALAQPAGALVLDNWFPTSTGIRTRGGSRKYATISTGAVTRMWSYKSGEVEEFFAADAENIFSVTTVADPDVIPTPEVSGQTSGYYSTAQIGTAGGTNYLYAVNGTDSAQLYDGSIWTTVTGVSTPAITGVTTADLSFVWLYASRLYFVEKETLSAWYLPIDSIGGAAVEVSLAGIFQEGGHLLFGGRWSMDSGDGLDDKCIFVSSEGEVAVYQGLYPGDASWQKVGVYHIAPPMGPNATMQAGGDFLIATESGIVPISEAVHKDAAALDLSAVTRSIETEWRAEVVRRKSLPWEIVKWPTRNMMVVSLPVPDESIESYCFVANLQTGAWTRFTGWDTRCIAHYADSGYFGTNDGKIYVMDTGGSDDGTPYVCTYVGLPDHLDSPGVTKTIHQSRAIFKSNVPFVAQISASTDYQIDIPPAPSSVTDFTVDVWDVGLWDVALWDAVSTSQTTSQWVSIGKTGFSASPQIQITCGVTPTPTTELVAFDMLFENGTVMT